MATDEAVQTAGMEDSADVVSMALNDLGMQPSPDKDTDEDESSETISDNSDETEETEEDSEDSADEPDEEDSEPEDKDPGAEVPKDKVQKRIDKLIAKQREAEERAEATGSELEQVKQAKAELEAQLNQTTRPILSPTADNPLADVDSEDALEQRIQNAQAVRRWALKNSDGATIQKPDGSEQFVSSDEVKDYLIKADDIITVHAPARKQWINNRVPSISSAQNLFPEMFKAGSPANQAYQATIKAAPDMLKIPQHELWIGLALYGEQQLIAQRRANEAKSSAENRVSSKKSESKTPTPVKPVSAQKSSSRSAKLSGTSLEDIQEWVAGSIL